MSMSDITTEIRFGAAFGIDVELMKSAKNDIIKSYRLQAGRELGEKIVEQKQWLISPDVENKMYMGELRLLVFTPNELSLFVEVKIKSKLIEMSQRAETPDDFRQQLIDLSERV